ncbi:ATP-dependent zinc protease family protein [Vibrio algarum]|uniref:ATP-dependent zinc protease n=1 Tax=Vibrio algarum TaxID=3020714 RepID=A0ABT4YS03_9VIBR|nr:ATP-dependent zinc protease [Vibrio sp. KJ40-1]MDB1124321.1 ATP-dependent zinc protease [Vibrio sp. KJ40-1]
MLKLAFSLIAISLLAGCASTSSEKQNQETLNAIKESESKIANEIETIKLGLSNQSDYIASLESEVLGLQNKITKLAPQKQISTSVTEVSSEEKYHETQASNQENPPYDHLVILGAIENVQLENIEQPYSARIDTGSTTSSINAVDIEEFERDGKKWVRFNLNEPDAENAGKIWIEAPVVRFANIRQSNSDTLEKRAVIELWVKIGEIHEKSQFTLANRSQMSHPVLLGREFIQDIALVDVSKTFLLSKPRKNI